MIRRPFFESGWNKTKMKDTTAYFAKTNQQEKAQSNLSVKQIGRLQIMLKESCEIHGAGNFPTLHVSLRDLIQEVHQQLGKRQMKVKETKLNGGVASHILAAWNDGLSFADVDLIYLIKLRSNDAFDAVKDAVLAALGTFLPPDINRAKIGGNAIQNAYIRKMMKVTEGNRWSLFALNNNYGRCIELKFVDKMQRQFEFSVDSFQITLDQLLGSDPKTPLVVRAESMYGDFKEALRHLNGRLIDTKRPEEIRGGGLLKYCHLLVRGFRAARAWKCRQLERYMCSRFFIDFPDVESQELKLRSYLDNHLGDESNTKYEYILLLHRVVSESTVCLMSHERRQTLDMIDRLAYHVSVDMYYRQSCRAGNCGHTPRQTVLYVPPNANYWIPVA